MPQHSRKEYLANMAIMSPEGACMIAFSLVAFFYRKEFRENAPAQANAMIASSLVQQVVASFFNYAVENRKTCDGNIIIKRDIALHDAHTFIKTAEEAQTKHQWMHASELYQLALNTLKSAIEIAPFESKGLQQLAADVTIRTAYCLLRAEKITSSIAILQEPLIAHHVHPASVHALRGWQHLHCKQLSQAAACFRTSLTIHHDQPTIFLLWLFATGQYQAIIDEFDFSFLGSTTATSSLPTSENVSDLLYYYALSFLRSTCLPPAIAILEAIHQTPKLPVTSTLKRDIHQTLAESYQQLAEAGDCDTYFSVSITAHESGNIDICRTATQNTALKQSELKARAETHRTIADRLQRKAQQLSVDPMLVPPSTPSTPSPARATPPARSNRFFQTITGVGLVIALPFVLGHMTTSATAGPSR